MFASNSIPNFYFWHAFYFESNKNRYRDSIPSKSLEICKGDSEIAF